jgi:hypothetical protein
VEHAQGVGLPAGIHQLCVGRRWLPTRKYRGQQPAHGARPGTKRRGVFQSEFFNRTQRERVRLQDTRLRLDIDIEVQGIRRITAGTHQAVEIETVGAFFLYLDGAHRLIATGAQRTKDNCKRENHTGGDKDDDSPAAKHLQQIMHRQFPLLVKTQGVFAPWAGRGLV